MGRRSVARPLRAVKHGRGRATHEAQCSVKAFSSCPEIPAVAKPGAGSPLTIDAATLAARLAQVAEEHRDVTIQVPAVRG
jgi:hypothetical protein